MGSDGCLLAAILGVQLTKGKSQTCSTLLHSVGQGNIAVSISVSSDAIFDHCQSKGGQPPAIAPLLLQICTQNTCFALMASGSCK